MITKNKIFHIFYKIKIEYVDMTDYKELENCIERNLPNVIFHLAGETSHKKSFENPLYDVDVNTKSTLCILEKIKNLNLKCKFILGSTFIVIGKPEKLPINEETPCNPTTIYGTNRLSSEIYFKIYNNVYGWILRHSELQIHLGQDKSSYKNAVIYLIFKAFKGEELTIYNEGKILSGFVYISDVVSALNTIMLKVNPESLLDFIWY